MILSKQQGAIVASIAVISVVAALCAFIFFYLKNIKERSDMKISNNGLDLIKRFEGLRLQAYKCSAGVWTIGYGHTAGVKEGDVCTNENAYQWLLSDVAVAENAVNSHKLKLTQNQFDALVSFCFNVGVGNFSKSTLLKIIKNDSNNPGIETEFLKWRYAGGKVIAGLETRRKAESKLYFG